MTHKVQEKENLTGWDDKRKKTKTRRVGAIAPPQTQLRSQVAWRLLRSRARALGQDVNVISADRQIRAVAKAAGFPVADSLESLPSDRPRPFNRLARRDRRGETSQGSKKQAASSNPDSSFFK